MSTLKGFLMYCLKSSYTIFKFLFQTTQICFLSINMNCTLYFEEFTHTLHFCFTFIWWKTTKAYHTNQKNTSISVFLESRLFDKSNLSSHFLLYILPYILKDWQHTITWEQMITELITVTLPSIYTDLFLWPTIAIVVHNCKWHRKTPLSVFSWPSNVGDLYHSGIFVFYIHTVFFNHYCDSLSFDLTF